MSLFGPPLPLLIQHGGQANELIKTTLFASSWINFVTDGEYRTKLAFSKLNFLEIF